MNRFVIYKNTTIHFELTYKEVKNLNLRVQADGRVCISASRSVPISVIDAFVLRKGAWVLSAIQKYAQLQKLLPPVLPYCTGDYIGFLGQKLRLNFVGGLQENSVLRGTELLLTVQNPESPEERKNAFHEFMYRSCREIFGQIMDTTEKLFQIYPIPKPTLKLRSMKTRWGTCHTQNGSITLNTRLISVPRDCIEYVVLHEFCHFIHPNHSKCFYGFLEQFMPDWQSRGNRLKNWPAEEFSWL